MLTDRNVAKINDMIKRELDTAGSFISSQEDKMAALERVSKLKSLLYPQPTAEELVEMLAIALKEKTNTTTQPHSLMEQIFGQSRF